MYFQYGAYRHQPDEVNFANFRIFPVRSNNGIRIATRYEMQLAGELIVDPTLTDKVACQADLTNKIHNLVNAYKDDYRDAGFYQDNGLPTPHILPNNHVDNLTGNIVIQRNWPVGDNHEYASCRTFSLGISAMFKNAYSQVLEYDDSIEQRGDGGSVIRWYNKRFGAPGYQILNNQSFVVYHHRGRMVTLDSFPMPPIPLYTRPFYLGDATTIIRSGPTRYAQGYRMYSVTWHYMYVLPTQALLLPTVR